MGESGVSDIVYFKCRIYAGTFSYYLLELVELDAIPSVDDFVE